MTKIAALFAMGSLAVLLGAAPGSMKTPLLLTNLRVVAGPDAAPVPATIAVSGGTIAFVGPEDEARRKFPNAETMDLSGGVAYPGFTDSHGHLAGLGEFLAQADLNQAESESQCVERLRRAADRLPARAWVKGRGWDQNLWPGKAFPDARTLDAAFPDRPAAASRVDGHSLWVNSEAMRRAGVTPATPDPPGGKIVRRPDGTPSGVFVDSARDLIWKVEPPAGAPELRSRFEAAMRQCAALGITGVGDASAYGDEDTEYGADRIEVLRAMAKAGELPIRVDATVGWNSSRSQAWIARGPFREGLLTVHAIKIYVDGALGSRGAALLEDYSDDPGNRGILVNPPERIEAAAETAFRRGFQIWIHAIGDRGCRIALDAIEAAENRVHPSDPRPRIEHAQVVSPEDLPRFRTLGVIASIQPVFATSDMPWAAARLSGRRIGESYAWRSLLRAGARLCGGSDFPNDIMDPRAGLYAAVTRQAADGTPAGGWRPEEDLTRPEALALYTSGAAYAFFGEGLRGELAAGKDADITVFDRDLAACPPSEIPAAKVLLTMVAGRAVYRGR